MNILPYTSLFIISLRITLPCAAEITSRAVVVDSIACAPDAATTVNLPYFRSVTFQDALMDSPSTASGGNYELISKKTGTWADGELAGTHALYFLAGPWTGRLFPISSDINGVLTIPGYGKNLSTILAGTDFEVVRLWDTETLLPIISQTTVPEAPADPMDRSSSLLIESHTPYRTNALVGYPANNDGGWTDAISSLSMSGTSLYINDALNVVHDDTVPASTNLILVGISPATPIVEDLDDSDNDSLSDAWELTYASDLGALGVPGTDSTGIDSDGDGFSDAAEESLGSNPLDLGSTFETAQTSMTTDGLNVNWVTHPGTLYQIWFSSDLNTWNEATSLMPGLGGTNTAFIPNENLPPDPERLFFRIGASY